jgi:uncharacterized membrane protein
MKSMTLARGGLALIGVLLILAALGTPAWSQQASQENVTDIELSGSGVAMTQNDSTFVWKDESFNLSISFTGSQNEQYEICAYRYQQENRTDTLGCTESVTAQNGTVTFPVNAFPSNETGRHTLQIVMSTGDGKPTANKTRSVMVVGRDGDLDGDGLTNQEELNQELNMTDADMDKDGLSDGTEVKNYNTDPTDPDTDGDGLRDGLELQLGTDPTDGRTVVKLTAGVLVLGVGLLGGWLLLRRRQQEAGTANPETEANDGEAAEEPLLTDEQRVIQLLEENDGRMKQAAIVDETEWSKAKVSRLLSDMVDEGKIEKLSIGRENIIHLEGHGPEAAKPPYSEGD